MVCVSDEVNFAVTVFLNSCLTHQILQKAKLLTHVFPHFFTDCTLLESNEIYPLSQVS